MKFLKRFLIISGCLGVLCLKPVTDVMPEPLKTAFTNARENALIVASGDGIDVPNITLPRGAWESKSASGVEHVGGR